jgi:hypothetical protein
VDPRGRHVGQDLGDARPVLEADVQDGRLVVELALFKERSCFPVLLRKKSQMRRREYQKQSFLTCGKNRNRMDHFKTTETIGLIRFQFSMITCFNMKMSSLNQDFVST